WCAVALAGCLLKTTQLGVEYFPLGVGRYDSRRLAELDQLAVDIFDRTRWRLGLPATDFTSHALHPQVAARLAFAERIGASRLLDPRFVRFVCGSLVALKHPFDEVIRTAMPVHAAGMIEDDAVSFSRFRCCS